MRHKRIDWPNIASATHGMNLNADQAAAWDHLLQAAFPDIKNSEICAALSGAMERDIKQKDPYRVTVRDLIEWIKLSRNGWNERTYVAGDFIYFPQRPRSCGQIQSRKATDCEIERHKIDGLYVETKSDVPRGWMEG